MSCNFSTDEDFARRLRTKMSTYVPLGRDSPTRVFFRALVHTERGQK